MWDQCGCGIGHLIAQPTEDRQTDWMNYLSNNYSMVFIDFTTTIRLRNQANCQWLDRMMMHRMVLVDPKLVESKKYTHCPKRCEIQSYM